MAAQASGEIWRARYDRWKASGLPLHEFAAKERVAPNSFRWWTRRLRQIEQELGTSMTLVRIADDEPSVADATSEIELVLPNAVRLRVPCGTPVQQLVALVTALGEVRFR